LRLKLVLIPTVILILGLAAAIVFALHGARARVQAEVESSLQLGATLIRAELDHVNNAIDPEKAVTTLGTGLPSLRHIRFVLESEPGKPAAVSSAKPAWVPAWFVHVFDVRPITRSFPIVANGHTRGWIAMVSHPEDEIAEIWDETQEQLLLLAVVSLLTGTFILIAVTIALRPLRELALGFDRLERGEFVGLAEPIRVTELTRIGEQFDSLARSLQRVTADNHRLIDRLISLQEMERKDVAHELHDEFGPALFGIRADVACILKWSAAGETRLTDIRERACSISALVDGIQRSTVQMLDRLRPLVLDQMGLAEALRQLVTTWQERYPDITWSLRVQPGTHVDDDEIALTLYRVVQECLTNVVRHAGATDVAVSLTSNGDAIDVAVCDNGRGIPPDIRFGFGLLGMSERVRGLGGRLQVGGGGGALVEASVPAKRALVAA
jgi:two-component system sensor histidine kinase UhpB